MALLAHLRSALGLPEAPAYLAGVSAGAAMAERVVLEHPDAFSGAALISGALDPAATPHRAAPALADVTLVMIGQEDPDFGRLQAVARLRRDRNGCRAVSRVAVRAAATTEVYECDGARLEEWRMEAGHVWPGAADSGPLSWPEAPFAATDEILRMFGLSGPSSRLETAPPANGGGSAAKTGSHTPQ